MGRKVIIQSESGDWFLVPEEHADTFIDDELEENVTYQVDFLNWPSEVKIKDYDFE